MALILATRNPHKLREFARLLSVTEIEPLPPEIELPPETGETFAQNALVKARVAAQATGRPAIADDSGISADALDGAPGVYSARYAGPHATDEENLAKLIKEVPAGTSLHYTCVLAYVDPTTNAEQTFEGRCDGHMAPAPAGDRGFGYDPIFIPTEWPSLTMAQLSDREKDSISHRGRALRAFEAWLTRPS